LDSQVSLGVALVVAGVLTLGIRLSFIALVGRLAMRDWFWRALRFVPIAVFAAIIVSEMVSRGPSGFVVASWQRLAAAVVAVGVAWRTGNVVLTISVGMAAMWALQALALA
jgi:branched-subunit amino acid transport protein